MNLEQYYKDIVEYDISPNVFEFDPNPTNKYISMGTPMASGDNEYESISTYLSKKLGFQQPFRSAAELEQERIEREAQEAKEKAEAESQAIAEYKKWEEIFNKDSFELPLTNVTGDLDNEHLKFIKNLFKDDDYTYIYAGSKDRSLGLEIDDVCAHVKSSRIKDGKLYCKVVFDCSPVGIQLYKNYKAGFVPKLNLNTVLTYNENDPDPNMRFICLEFI